MQFINRILRDGTEILELLFSLMDSIPGKKGEEKINSLKNTDIRTKFGEQLLKFSSKARDFPMFQDDFSIIYELREILSVSDPFEENSNIFILEKLVDVSRELTYKFEGLAELESLLPDNDATFKLCLPEDIDTLKKFSKTLEELDFIFTHYPYFRKKDVQMKFAGIEEGSILLAFTIIGVTSIGVTTLLELYDKTISVRSRRKTLETQELALQNYKFSSELNGMLVEEFKKLKENLYDDAVKELEAEFGELADGEERDKARRSLQKFDALLERKMKLQASIDTDVKISPVFEEVRQEQLTEVIKMLIDKEINNK